MNQEVSILPYDTQCNIALFLGVPNCHSSAEIWFHVQVLNKHMVKCLLPCGEGPLLALLLGTLVSLMVVHVVVILMIHVHVDIANIII